MSTFEDATTPSVTEWLERTSHSYVEWARETLATKGIRVASDATERDVNAIFESLHNEEMRQRYIGWLGEGGSLVDPSLTLDEARGLYQLRERLSREEQAIRRFRDAGVPVNSYEEAHAFEGLQ